MRLKETHLKKAVGTRGWSRDANRIIVSGVHMMGSNWRLIRNVEYFSTRFDSRESAVDCILIRNDIEDAAVIRNQRAAK